MMNWTTPTGWNRMATLAEGPRAERRSEEVAWIRRLNGEFGGAREDVTAFSTRVHGGSEGGPRDSVIRGGTQPVPHPNARLSHVRGSNRVWLSGGRSATQKEPPRYAGEDSRGRMMNWTTPTDRDRVASLTEEPMSGRRSKGNVQNIKTAMEVSLRIDAEIQMDDVLDAPPHADGNSNQPKVQRSRNQ